MENHYYIRIIMTVVGVFIFLDLLYFPDELFLMKTLDRSKKKGVYFLDGCQSNYSLSVRGDNRRKSKQLFW